MLKGICVWLSTSSGQWLIFLVDAEWIELISLMSWHEKSYANFLFRDLLRTHRIHCVNLNDSVRESTKRVGVKWKVCWVSQCEARCHSVLFYLVRMMLLAAAKHFWEVFFFGLLPESGLFTRSSTWLLLPIYLGLFSHDSLHICGFFFCLHSWKYLMVKILDQIFSKVSTSAWSG